MLDHLNIRNKKYLIRIILLTSITTLLLLSVFSSVVYVNVKKAAENSIVASNRQIFEQIKYNITYTDEIIRNMCLSVYYNPDVIYMMNTLHSDADMFEIAKSINKIKSSLLVINYQIHSMYVYNNLNKRFYGTYSGVLYEEQELIQLVKGSDGIPLRKPIYRQLRTIFDKQGQEYEDVISYFMYDEMDEEGNMKGGIVINIKPEWVISNIKKINMVNNSNQEELFIVTGDKKILKDKNETIFGVSPSAIYDDYISAHVSDGKTFNFSNEKINGQEYFVSFMHLETIDWTIVKIQPLGNVFYLINRIQSSIIIITLSFLLAAIVISISISTKIYYPVKRLVSLVETRSKATKTNHGDEINVIENAIMNFEKNQDKLALEMSVNKDKLKDSFIRNIVLDSASMNAKEFDNAVESGYFLLDTKKKFFVCVMKIDNFTKFSDMNRNKDKQLMKFAISNITNEILNEKFRNQIIDFTQDQIVVLLNQEDSSSTYADDMQALFKKAQNYVSAYFDISFSVAVGPVVHSCSDISVSYLQAVNMIHYRYLFGKSAIITYEKIKNNENNMETNYAVDFEEKLGRHIKHCDDVKFEEVLTQGIKDISKLQYHHAFISMIKLVSTIRKNIFELSNAQLTPVDIDFNEVTKDFFEIETMEEVHSKLASTVCVVLEKIKNGSDNKNVYINESIKEIIESKYMEQSLCLQEIASTLKMSSNYIGRVFKERMGVSISQYINQVRIEMAAKWLLSSNMSVKDIMAKVAIDNEAHFYRHFKNRFGVTPKDYALKNNTMHE